VSVARTITWFDPTSNGIEALHRVVPEAVPLPPVLVENVTLATPEGSDAVPLNVSQESDVATDVLAGYVIVSAGAAVSVPGGGGGGAAVWRVTLTV